MYIRFTRFQRIEIVASKYRLMQFVTARCYEERGIATVNRLSVCPSVTLTYHDDIG